MAISATSSTTPDYTTTSTTTKSEENRSSLGKDDFLNLFVQSLQYQDPTSPMETGEMMQQMSQLGMMEAVTNMQSMIETLSDSMKGNQLQQGASLLGQEITGTDNNGSLVTGEVEQVSMNDGILSLLADGKTVEIGNVLTVNSSKS